MENSLKKTVEYITNRVGSRSRPRTLLMCINTEKLNELTLKQVQDELNQYDLFLMEIESSITRFVAYHVTIKEEAQLFISLVELITDNQIRLIEITEELATKYISLINQNEVNKALKNIGWEVAFPIIPPKPGSKELYERGQIFRKKLEK